MALDCKNFLHWLLMIISLRCVFVKAIFNCTRLLPDQRINFKQQQQRSAIKLSQFALQLYFFSIFFWVVLMKSTLWWWCTQNCLRSVNQWKLIALQTRHRRHLIHRNVLVPSCNHSITRWVPHRSVDFTPIISYFLLRLCLMLTLLFHSGWWSHSINAPWSRHNL